MNKLREKKDRDLSAAATDHREVNGSSRRNLSVSGILQSYGLIIAWLIVIGLFGILRPDPYLTGANASNILGTQAVLVIVAMGLLVALRTGLYDLSVAATLTMSSVTVGVLNAQQGWPLLLAIAAAMGLAIVIGLFNTFFIVVIGIDSIVVTLGTATLLQGLAIWMSGAQTITGISDGLVQWVVGHRVIGIPLEFFYALILTIVMWVLYQYTGPGRRMLYVGKNPEVARLSGVSVGRTRLVALVLSASISGLAGIVYTGTSGVASPTSGLSYLLPAFAACFLGATAIRVGEFNAWGTLIASYFLISGVTGLSIIGVPSFIQQVFYGAALILAVTLSQLAAKRAADSR